jgi:hypothetical protein
MFQDKARRSVWNVGQGRADEDGDGVGELRTGREIELIGCDECEAGGQRGEGDRTPRMSG